MGRTNDMPDSYVTRAEFAEFRDDVQASLKNISEKLDVKTGTNWGVVWSALGVVALMIAGAWALVNTQINAAKAETASYIKADEARKQLIENITIGELKAKARYYDDLIYARLATPP